jgi:hypothetical protein
MLTEEEKKNYLNKNPMLELLRTEHLIFQIKIEALLVLVLMMKMMGLMWMANWNFSVLKVRTL